MRTLRVAGNGWALTGLMPGLLYHHSRGAARPRWRGSVECTTPLSGNGGVRRTHTAAYCRAAHNQPPPPPPPTGRTHRDGRCHPGPVKRAPR